MKVVNLETIIDTLWWFKTWQHSGYNHTRAKQNFQETEKSLQKFLEPTRKPKVIYTDNSVEFGNSFEDLSWNHCTSIPHRSETNCIVERAVRRIKDGTSAVLLQSGLDEKWSADSMVCYCYLRNIQDLLSDGKTPYQRRFGVPFQGPVILFGAMVEYHPMSAKDLSRLHQFGSKVLPGKFLGYALHAGGIWFWHRSISLKELNGCSFLTWVDFIYSKQSSILGRGTRFSYSMDSVVHVQNINISGDGKDLRKFLEPSENPKVIYIDNSLEFGKSCEQLSWNYRTSKPHRSETNGIAERRRDVCCIIAIRLE